MRIVFYAGHGAQVRGHNHLIPVDAPMSSADELTARSLTADGRRLKVRGAAKGLAAPGVPLEQMFKRVRVMRESAQRQRPWEESSLTVDYCLAGC